MNILDGIVAAVVDLVKQESGVELTYNDLTISPTRKEFTGDYTLLVFPLVRHFKKSPEDTASFIGNKLLAQIDEIKGYNVIKGFLNLEFGDDFWISTLQDIIADKEYTKASKKGEKVMVEYSSPNTNKPLHLGHIRNILLGWSVSAILEDAGYDVVRTQVINDRGIAVCKSMLAWRKFGNEETPESSGMKGDHLVGKYYVEFDQRLKQEYEIWQQSTEAIGLFEAADEEDIDAFFKSYKNDYFNLHSSLGKEARDMLLKWEAKEEETMALWNKMNGWVYEGFEKTYAELGVHFDSNYYESNTFRLGKEIVEEGMDKSLFYKETDNSIWVDLTDAKMDKKILLRSDGTALYITQDLGTAELRYHDHKATKMVYVVGDEQDYHFKVLFEIIKRLDRPYANGLFHLSYGMVDLPTGRMKSREGTVVDADVLMEEVIDEARKSAISRAEEQGKELLVSEEDIKKIALAALKYFIIKVNPQKRMVFNPEESLDMQGQTGPYIQNAYVRIRSIFRKAGKQGFNGEFSNNIGVKTFEKDLIASLIQYPDLVQTAAEEYQPSLIANYCYDLAKKMHKYYAEVNIIREENKGVQDFRLELIGKVADVLASGMKLLGIDMVERM